MESINLLKTDKGMINGEKIRWIYFQPEKDCFQICVRSTGCILEDTRTTWSVCKKDSYSSFEEIKKKFNL
jgi:hypothetical protein